MARCRYDFVPLPFIERGLCLRRHPGHALGSAKQWIRQLTRSHATGDTLLPHSCRGTQPQIDAAKARFTVLPCIYRTSLAHDEAGKPLTWQQPATLMALLGGMDLCGHHAPFDALGAVRGQKQLRGIGPSGLPVRDLTSNVSCQMPYYPVQQGQGSCPSPCPVSCPLIRWRVTCATSP